MIRKHSGLWIIVVAAFLGSHAGCKSGNNGMTKAQAPAMPAVDAASLDIAAGPPAPDAPPDVDEPAADLVKVETPNPMVEGVFMQGPKPTMNELCGGCKEDKELTPLPEGPYKSVKLVYNEWDSPSPGPMLNDTYALAVQTSEGWFVKTHLGTAGILCGGKSLFHVGFTFESWEIRDIIPGGAPELLVEWKGSANGIRDEFLLICGIGPSKKPSCIGPYMPKRNHPDGYSKSWESKVVFLPGGRLELHGDTWVQGPFTLTFP
ncbi:MAG: hypothetical protein ABIJ56_03610 [Pseudomonadota bacterium]